MSRMSVPYFSRNEEYFSKTYECPPRCFSLKHLQILLFNLLEMIGILSVITVRLLLNYCSASPDLFFLWFNFCSAPTLISGYWDDTLKGNQGLLSKYYDNELVSALIHHPLIPLSICSRNTLSSHSMQSYGLVLIFSYCTYACSVSHLPLLLLVVTANT